MQVKAVFVQKSGGPERLVAEGELVFGDEAGPLAGLKLVGFALWRGAEGDVYVTVPSRSFGGGSERRFFDLLRSANSETPGIKAFKEWLVNEYRSASAAA